MSRGKGGVEVRRRARSTGRGATLEKIVKMPSQKGKGEEHGSQLGDVLGFGLDAHLTPQPEDPRVYAHTMYFAVFWLHTMYFGDFGGRWLRPLGRCKALIPGDVDEIASATGISATGESAGAVQLAPRAVKSIQLVTSTVGTQISLRRCAAARQSFFARPSAAAG